MGRRDTRLKLGMMPVYLPNLLDHQTKVLDIPLVNAVLHEALPNLPDGVKQAILYYVDIYDRAGVEKFIADGKHDRHPIGTARPQRNPG